MKPPPTPAKKTSRKRAAHPSDPAAVADRLRALAPPGELPALWSQAEISRRLTPAERPQLDAALARLQAERQLIALSQGKHTFYLFAEPMRGWLAGAALVALAAEHPPEEPKALVEVYRRLVRESGGFPDVKISALQAALGPMAADTLVADLIAHWRRGEATFSLGDWSLASEETRAAAVEMDGEKYLLVRFEEL